MPKLKTNKSAKKRFKLTKTGKVKRHKAFTSHLMQRRSPKRKRNLRQSAICAPGDARVAKLLIAPGE